jgi:DNA-binding transcriptional LysR family regulator
MADLRTLAIFVKVAERKSFVRAADDLGITQSGVSNAIKRLEEQTGTRLLARTTRRVSLTDDGTAFFERCRQALAEIDEAEQVLKEAQLTPSGNLRVDLPVSFGRIKMVPLLGPFQARYPDVRLSVSFTDRYIDLIEEGTPAYFAKHGLPKTPDDLANHNCLAFTFRDTRLARLWRFATADGQITRSPEGNMTFSDGAAVCEATCVGYGLAQLHDYYLDHEIARGKLVSVLDRFSPTPEPIWLVYPQTRHLTPKVRAFVDFMAAQFRVPERRTPARRK